MSPQADSLRGIRVLDLSQYLPGPFASQMLADLGAEVLKIEPPGGDPMRELCFLDGDGISPFYKQVNAGKAVVRLDLKTSEGKTALEGLVAAADVLLESYRPGMMERLGFSPSRLRELNPALVHCALSGFGQTGPWRLRGGHDLTYVALSGGLSVTGTEAVSTMTFPPLADHAGAMQAVTAILAALFRRERTGSGMYLDISIFETTLSWQSMGLAAALRPEWRMARGHDLLNGGAACYQIYETAEGRFVALGAIEEKFWSAFCEAAGHPEWILRRKEPMPQKSLISEVQEFFKGGTRREWEERFGGVDCCFEPVLEYSEVPRHPQVLQRGIVRSRGGADPMTEVLFPVHADGRPPRERSPLQEISPAEALGRWIVEERAPLAVHRP